MCTKTVACSGMFNKEVCNIFICIGISINPFEILYSKTYFKKN